MKEYFVKDSASKVEYIAESDSKSFYPEFSSICKNHNIEKKDSIKPLFACYTIYCLGRSSGNWQPSNESLSARLHKVIELIKVITNGGVIRITSARGGGVDISDKTLTKEWLLFLHKYLVSNATLDLLSVFYETRPDLLNDEQGAISIFSDFEGLLTEEELDKYNKDLEIELSREKIYVGRGKEGNPILGKVVHDFLYAANSIKEDYDKTTINNLIASLMEKCGVLAYYKSEDWVKRRFYGMTRKEVSKQISEWHNSFNTARKKVLALHCNNDFLIDTLIKQSDSCLKFEYITTKDKEMFKKSNSW